MSKEELDASLVRPSMGLRLKNCTSMLEFSEIESIKKCGDSIMQSYDCDRNSYLGGDCHESKDGPDDDDDFCFIDIQSETQVPLNDVQSSSLSSYETMQSNLTHKCHSMLNFKSSTIHEDQPFKIKKQTTNNIGDEGGLKRIDSQSILKSSPSYVNLPQDQMQRTTSFGTLEIREYPITLGDNPGGGKGPPVSLDWKHNEKRTKVIALEVYEDLRGPRRDRREMHMADNLRRWRLLRENGCTIEELNKASSAAENVRRQRKKSLKSEPPLSKMKKKIGKMIGSSNKEIRRYSVTSFG